jgi:hypothetical protein
MRRLFRARHRSQCRLIPYGLGVSLPSRLRPTASLPCGGISLVPVVESQQQIPCPRMPWRSSQYSECPKTSAMPKPTLP